MPALTDRQEERELLDKVRAGSTEALGQLYARHAEAVHRLAYRVTASAEDAEDVLQDVFVGLPRALEAYRERGRFEAWLKRVTVRTALMRLRAHRRRQEESVDALLTPPTNEPEPVVERIAVRRALAALPDGLRSVFVLKEIEGYSHAEIADFLGITSGASAVRLSRAWDLLRKGIGYR